MSRVAGINTSTTSIHSFPTEILYEILKYLDWRTLLSVKLICRAWRSALKSRQFWYGHVTNLLSEPRATPLEEPVADYTTSELESWVIRCLRAQECWRTNVPSMLTTVHKSEDSFAGWQIKLVPGGRWVLSLDWKGVLFSYDMDNPDNGKRMLIDAGEKTEGHRYPDHMKEIIFWIDPSKAKLSFRLALWNTSRSIEDSFSRVCIYQVDLVGHGNEATLQAESMKVLQVQAEFDDYT